MKKIIYGLIVLLGGVLIASNFNVDSSKLDHKTVSASGTACKWISDTGFGFAPLYYSDNTHLVEEDSKVNFSWSDFNDIVKKIKNGLKVLKCDSSVTGHSSLNAKAIYDSNYNLLNIQFCRNSGADCATIENGLISNGYYFDVITHYQTVFTDESTISYDDASSTTYPNLWRAEYYYELDPSTFTCVCAEY